MTRGVVVVPVPAMPIIHLVGRSDISSLLAVVPSNLVGPVQPTQLTASVVGELLMLARLAVSTGILQIAPEILKISPEISPTVIEIFQIAVQLIHIGGNRRGIDLGRKIRIELGHILPHILEILVQVTEV